MQCKDVMKQPVVTCREHDSAACCAAIMAERGIGFLPVVSDKGKLVGVVTDRDLVVRVLASQRGASVGVKHVMSKNVVRCSPEDSLADAERRLGMARKSRIVLVDDWDRVVGVLSIADIGQVEDDIVAGRLFRQVTRREATGVVARA